MEIEIKYAKQKDISAISKVMADTWRTTYQGIFDDEFLKNIPDDKWISAFTKRLEEKKPILIATVNDQVVAATTYGPGRLIEYKSMDEIYSLYVLEEHQGMGIGKRLLVKAIEDLDNDSIYLLTASNNKKARSFYESMGFKESGTVLNDKFGQQEIEEVVYVLKMID